MFGVRTDAELIALLGTRAKEQRLFLNVTQKEMAEFCGVTRKTIANFEGGKGVTLITLIRILRRLNLEEAIQELIPAPPEVDPFQPTPKKRQRAS